jgi:hypothetical protein
MGTAAMTFIDGPRFVAWLRDRGALGGGSLTRQVGERWESSVRRWEKGRAVFVHTADEFLLTLGVQLGEVPEDLYRRGTKGRGNEVTEGERARMWALRDDGLGIGEIARLLGRDHKTIRNHLRRSAA